jgi:hypothetical protein
MDTQLYRMAQELAIYCQENNITLALFASVKREPQGACNVAVMNGNAVELVKLFARSMDEKREIKMVVEAAVEASQFIANN